MADEVREACAGVLLETSDGHFLLLYDPDSKCWVEPGGHLREGETGIQAAIREVYEETGLRLQPQDLALLRTVTTDAVSFEAYKAVVNAFTPVLSREHSGYVWSVANELPSATLGEVRELIADVSGTETDIAASIRDGKVASPQRFQNVWLFDMRITGTGTAYRTALGEYSYRDPEAFLTDAFLARCAGLPVVMEHPSAGILDSREFRNRTIGTVVLPYIRGDEVWGIAKIFDDQASERMREQKLSTSPSVVFRSGDDVVSEPFGDETILLEGVPSYIDHLAVCANGVWDKGETPNGIHLAEDFQMADSMTLPPLWARQLIKAVDSLQKRMNRADKHIGFDKLRDKVEGEGYSKEAATKIAGKVAAEKGETGKRKDADDEVKLPKDTDEEGHHVREDEDEDEREEKAALGEAKAASADVEAAHEDLEAAQESEDAEEEDDKEGDEEEKDEGVVDAKDDADDDDSVAEADAKKLRADADVIARKIASLESRLQRVSKPLTYEDRDAIAQAQLRADALTERLGLHPVLPLAGERPIEYRKRVASRMQRFCDAAKGIDLGTLPPKAFAMIEQNILADAAKFAEAPESVQSGRLIPVHSKDAAGRTITRYHGDSRAWMEPFFDKGFTGRIADQSTFRRSN